MTSFSNWEQLDRQFRFLISRALPREYGGAVSLVLSCPKFPDSPIVAALTGFEAVCGYPPGSFIGRNCRFMNRGLKNDPETLSELRAMQESPANARSFTANNPKGKHYLMRNRRPARMSSSSAVGTPLPSNSISDDGKCYIEFFNLLHIFGFEVKRDKQPKTPVLVGLQFVLTSGLNQNIAEKLTGEVQDLLMNPHSNIRHVFFDWCRLALSVYEEYIDWNDRGNMNVARRQTEEGLDTQTIPESIPDSYPDMAELTEMLDSNIRLAIPESQDLQDSFPLSPLSDTRATSTRQDAYRFLPSREFNLEFPSKSSIPPLGDAVAPFSGDAVAPFSGDAAAPFCGVGFNLTDEGEDSSTLLLRKSPRAESNSSLDASSYGARSTPRPLYRGDSTEKQQHQRNAKHLLDKIKEVEKTATEWAKTKGDEKSGARVKELVTLREALCDDFASDLDLYIAFYCVSKELQEG